MNYFPLAGDIPIEENVFDAEYLEREGLDNITKLTQRSNVEFYHDINYTTTWDYIEDNINSDPNEDNIELPWSRDKYKRSGKEGQSVHWHYHEVERKGHSLPASVMYINNLHAGMSLR